MKTICHKDILSISPLIEYFLPINELVPVRRLDKPTVQETTKKV